MSAMSRLMEQAGFELDLQRAGRDDGGRAGR
jgi:hypothetical protein